jgi:membrane peptidoglycan carboxypeptidase
VQSNPRVRTPRRRLVAIVLAVAVAVPLLAISAAWIATPGIGDLSRRVAQRTPGRAPAAPLGSVTRVTIDALVATEDERYWNNSGIDVIGLMRAIPYDVTHLSLAQGGSTLTEQLAKNLWLGGSDENAWAKLKDMTLALKLDQRYSKDTILSAYLDTAYFGQGAYGIASASRRYFGVAPRALDDAEATVLVGLVQAPTSYDPYTHPAASRLRQVAVLRSLVRVGKIPVARAGRWLAEPLRLANGRTVPGIEGVDLSPGQAVDGIGIGIAVAAALAALAAAIVERALRARHPLVARAASIGAIALLCAALVAAVRSLRVV